MLWTDNLEGTMSTFRPNWDIAPEYSQPPKAAGDGALRDMQWDISANRAIYSCSCCAWELVAEIGTCPEPLRVFHRHSCEENRGSA